jgi:hypothetical protein
MIRVPARSYNPCVLLLHILPVLAGILQKKVDSGQRCI